MSSYERDYCFLCKQELSFDLKLFIFRMKQCNDKTQGKCQGSTCTFVTFNVRAGNDILLNAISVRACNLYLKKRETIYRDFYFFFFNGTTRFPSHIRYVVHDSPARFLLSAII